MTEHEVNEIIQLISNKIEQLRAESSLKNQQSESALNATEKDATTGGYAFRYSHTDTDAEILNRDRKKEHFQLSRTLEWLKGDQPGNCVACSCPVTFERLKSKPTSRLCNACAQYINGDK